MVWRSRWIGILLLSIFLTALAAAPAFGHAELVAATPAEGEDLPRAPTEVRLRFGEPVEAAFDPIEVYDPDGNRVDGDDGRSDPNDASVVVTSLEDGLPAGSYTVEWTVTSADGDPVSGEYSFGVDASSGEAAGPAQGGGVSGGELSQAGGSGPIAPYAGLALGAIALLSLLGFSLRGRVR